jgi:hypothetical protein
MRQSVVTPERFAKGRTSDEYVKYAGSPENLAREVSVGTTPTHQEAPRKDNWLRERYARAV